MPEAEPPPGLLGRIWRFPLVQLVVAAGVVILAAQLGSVLLHLAHLPRNSPQEFAGGVAIAAGIVLAYKGYKRWLERKPDPEFEPVGAARELGLGLAFGFVLFSLAAGAVWALGGLQIDGLRGIGQLWSMLLMAVISGTLEETLFRGIVMRQMEAMIGTWGALAFTSGFFGLVHLGNQGATWWSALAIALEAGVLLGAAYLLTRRLWLAIGIHAAWNFTQGWVFSVPVSGGAAPLGLLVTRRTGPDWMTGGEFGLEASVVAIVIATLAGIALLYRAVGQGQIVEPMWRRSGVQPSG
ncbi:MAG: lysostaphin resistance A-like protein [Novosphingobium sp.]